MFRLMAVVLLAFSISTSTEPSPTEPQPQNSQNPQNSVERSLAASASSRYYDRASQMTALSLGNASDLTIPAHVPSDVLSRAAETPNRVQGYITRLEAREAKQAAREARQAARAAQQQQQQQPTSPVVPPSTSGGSGGLPSLLVSIKANESGGNYNAYNAAGCLGGCYGAYQMAGAYMGAWAVNAGYPGYNYAGFWPPEVQDAVALWMYNQPNGAYVYWCQWTTYC